MPRPAFDTVDEYLAAQPPAPRKTLALVRRAIRKALPGAEECISYGMPTYKVDGHAVIYFCGWKAHFSIYPAPRDLATLGAAAAALKVAKGTLRFALDDRVPSALIAQIARLNAREAAARRRPRAARTGSGSASVVRSR